MDSPRTKLIKGSIKSAMASLAGVYATGNLVMPENFSLATWTGVRHNLLFTGGVVLFAEGRYAWQWIKKWTETDGSLDQALDAAAVASKEASVQANRAADAVAVAQEQVPKL